SVSSTPSLCISVFTSREKLDETQKFCVRASRVNFSVKLCSGSDIDRCSNLSLNPVLQISLLCYYILCFFILLTRRIYKQCQIH
ncbi:hypothetical protein V1527DRAFT_519116, partial [Lipomyces starkeyi]